MTIRWVQYKTTAGPRWHAWGDGALASLCGHVKAYTTDGAIIGTADRAPEQSKEAPVCRHCLRRVAPSSRQRQHRPKLSQSCACDDCRAARKEHAAVIPTWLAQDVVERACSCVERALDPELDALIYEAERRLAHRLLLWEMTGTGWEDVLSARDLIMEGWETAVRAYRASGRPHACDPCSPARRDGT
jgi:hypothetical protein